MPPEATPTPSPAAERDTRLTSIADELATQISAGQLSSVDDLAASHPDLAEEIRDLFAALTELPPPACYPSHMPKQLGGYRILRELARGGMGVVFEARDETLDRRVALKVLQLSASDAHGLATRFEREARAAARLHHPHIVPVYDVGFEAGLHYYAMQFIEGHGMDAWLRHLSAGDLRDPARWEEHVRRATRLTLEVAEALAHAHAHGILHRDIKPSNILIDSNDHAWVTDFGLCKTADASDLTRTGDVVGTLRYLAPEGLHGETDARSDVYSLGITLFQLLARRHPFGDAETGRRLSMARTIPRVGRHEPRVPRDLETIVQRATRELPAQRYASATEFADDLRAFLDSRPIAARQPHFGELLRLATARNPILTGTVALASLLLLASTVFYVWGLNLALGERDAGLRRARAVTLASASSEAVLQDPLLALLLAREAAHIEMTPRTLSQLHQSLATLHERAVLSIFEEDIEQLLPWPDGTGFLCVTRHALEAWTWVGVRLARFTSESEIENVELAPTGRRLAFSTHDRSCSFWDLDRTAVPRRSVFRVPPDAGAVRLRFGADGTRLVTVHSKGYTLHDATSWQPLTSASTTWGEIHDAALLNSSASLIVAVAGGRILGLDSLSSRLHWERKIDIAGFLRLTQGNVGAEFAVYGGSELQRFDEEGHALGRRVVHDDRIQSATFTPEGAVVTASSDQTARSWDRDGRLLNVFRGHGGAVNQATVAPDGRHVVTASADQSAGVWKLDGTPVCSLRGHDASVNAALLSPHSATVVTASTDKTLRLWDLHPAGLPVYRGHSLGLYSASISPDGALVVTGGRDRTARLWTRDGIELGTFSHEDLVYSAGFLPDGQRVFTTTSGPTAYVWRLDGTLEFAIESPEKRILCGWFGADGWLFVARGHDDTAILLAADGQIRARLRGHEDLVWSAAFSVDGQSIATTSLDRSARVWDLSGETRWELRGHEGLPNSVRFDRRGQHVVTGSDDGTARVWSTLDGQCRAILRGHEGAVLSAAFSPEGQQVLTASRDQTARVWTLGGDPVVTLNGHAGVVWSAEFSGDGNHIATSSFDRTARLWWAKTEDVVRAAEQRAFRGFTAQERSRYAEILGGSIEPVGTERRITGP